MYFNNPNINDILNKIEDFNLNNDEILGVFVGENSKINIKKLINELNEKDIEFFGGIFPKVVYKQKASDKNIVIKKFKSLFEDENINKSIMVKKLHQGINKEKSKKIKKILKNKDKKKTFITLVDGLSENIEGFLENLYNNFGDSINYFGGGAGSMSLKQQPCLFNNKVFYEGSALIVPIDLSCELGVKHGWQSAYGPFVATKVENNKIKELNWSNAFEVYKEVVNNDLNVKKSDKKIDKDNFFSIAKKYPFGILQENSEKIVRDPIEVNNKGEIICVGKIPSNASLNILRGEKDKLIKSAKESLPKVKKKENINHNFLIDCISRTLFLEDDFEKELEVISQESKKESVFGCLTLGEISSKGEGYIKFYNKTIVMGVFID